tara:strand:+ start:9459 stop:10214 length:756 start_codon:yes stop_codon:yes gene_type:complete
MVLNQFAIKRIAKDVKYIIKNPIKNIYYKHSDDNILNGYALIIGNENTIYYNCNYLFEFKFPDNYPFEPPKLTFLTIDNKMRYHPNLYSNGKVCLSILNTWNGPGWTSCNNINSILLILQSILDNNSLTHEPGISIKNINVNKYNILVNYKNIEFSIIKQINFIYEILKLENNDGIVLNTCMLLFKDEIINNYKENFEKIKYNLENLEKDFLLVNKNIINNNINISIYQLNYILNFKKLNMDLINLYKNIK